MNYTTIKQSEKLLELGLSPETADMYYFCDPTPAGNIMIPTLIIIEKHLHSRLPEYNKGDVPCWSLGALLELMPKSIEDKANYYEITVYYSKTESEWYLGYITIDMRRTFKVFHNISLIEAAFNMIIYLLENGYIKTEKI